MARRVRATGGRSRDSPDPKPLTFEHTQSRENWQEWHHPFRTLLVGPTLTWNERWITENPDRRALGEESARDPGRRRGELGGVDADLEEKGRLLR